MAIPWGLLGSVGGLAWAPFRAVGLLLLKRWIKRLRHVKAVRAIRSRLKVEIRDRMTETQATPDPVDDVPWDASWAFMGFATMCQAQRKLGEILVELGGRDGCERAVRMTREAIRILDEDPD